jgi:Protein of unknown function (DUF1580)
MCDILHENVITMTEAPGHIPGRPHSATIWRWWNRGIEGIKLETFMVGGRRFTSTEAITRFIKRTTAAQDEAIAKHVLSRKRQAEIAKAERELTEAGI